MSQKTLLSLLENSLNQELRSFLNNIEMEYKLPTDELWKRWSCTTFSLPQDKSKTVSLIQEDTKKSKETSNKKSNYQVFFSQQYNEIMKKQPDISFGEVSKRVSAIWKSLPKEEKVKYIVPSPGNETKSVHVITTTNISTASTVSTLPTLNGSVAIKDNSIPTKAEIVYTSRKKTDPKNSRTKVELSAEDEKDDEDDFFFTESIEGDSDNDEDDMVDDDDIFADDD